MNLTSLALAAAFLVAALPASTLLQPAKSKEVPSQKSEPAYRVLVFSKTGGFRHDSIPDGIAAIKKLGAEHGFAVDATEDSAQFTQKTLDAYACVVFLSTTGNDILDKDQKAAFESYIAAGHGYVGVHAAADTEYNWPWYGTLVGAYFKSHPKIQEAKVKVENKDHVSTRHLEDPWTRTDEWYNYKESPRAKVNVLLSLDESSYKGGENGADHPIAWYHDVGAGRAWYTGGGHTKESYSEEAFLMHLLGGIQWAAGKAEDAKEQAAPSVRDN